MQKQMKLKRKKKYFIKTYREALWESENNQ